MAVERIAQRGMGKHVGVETVPSSAPWLHRHRHRALPVLHRHRIVGWIAVMGGGMGCMGGGMRGMRGSMSGMGGGMGGMGGGMGMKMAEPVRL